MADHAVRAVVAIKDAAWLKVRPAATRLALHGGAAARAAAAVAWDVPFAEEACRAYTWGGRASLWIGPDEYLLIDAAAPSEPPPAVPPSFAHLAQALQGYPHALVDVSHRQIGIEVAGPHAAAILNGGCPLDLDLAAFPVGMCTRTLCGKADIVLWRTGANAFHVEVWRSFSEYLVALLTEIARDVIE